MSRRSRPLGQRLPALAALLAAVALGGPARAQALPEQDVALRPAEGAETVAQNCGGCHSLDYIPMNAWFLKEDGWKAEVGKMRKAFGAPITDADAATIARYLSEQYSAATRP